VFICLSLISGCSATKYKGRSYDGPELPKDQVAALFGDDLDQVWHNQSTLVCRVDGKKVDVSETDDSVHVLPGEHSIMVMYTGGTQGQHAAEFTFSVEAGNDYRFTFDKDASGRQVVLWVENLTTKEKVKDIEASPLKSPLACVF
jgi:hypothetical protein